jgi:hypothetical protein
MLAAALMGAPQRVQDDQAGDRHGHAPPEREGRPGAGRSPSDPVTKPISARAEGITVRRITKEAARSGPAVWAAGRDRQHLSLHGLGQGAGAWLVVRRRSALRCRSRRAAIKAQGVGVDARGTDPRRCCWPGPPGGQVHIHLGGAGEQHLHALGSAAAGPPAGATSSTTSVSRRPLDAHGAGIGAAMARVNHHPVAAWPMDRAADWLPVGTALACRR